MSKHMKPGTAKITPDGIKIIRDVNYKITCNPCGETVPAETSFKLVHPQTKIAFMVCSTCIKNYTVTRAS